MNFNLINNINNLNDHFENELVDNDAAMPICELSHYNEEELAGSLIVLQRKLFCITQLIANASLPLSTEMHQKIENKMKKLYEKQRILLQALKNRGAL